MLAADDLPPFWHAVIRRLVLQTPLSSLGVKLRQVLGDVAGMSTKGFGLLAHPRVIGMRRAQNEAHTQRVPTCRNARTPPTKATAP